MIRRPDWWPRLKATVEDFEGRPFVWGATDCAHFAAACVQAMTGEDLLRPYRGTYTSRFQARARLVWWRLASVTDAAEAALLAAGCDEIDPRVAIVGDVGVSGEHIIAVRMPAGFIARGETGEFGIAKVERAWAVAWPN